MGQNIAAATLTAAYSFLVTQGITPNKLVGKDDAQIIKMAQEKGFDAKGIEVEQADATPATPEQQEAKQRRQKTDEAFVAKAKAYHDAVKEYEDKMKEYKVFNDNEKALYKKTLKKTVKNAKGEKVDKDQAREEATKAREKVAEELKNARDKMLAAKAELDKVGQTAQANRFNRENAETLEDKKRTGRTEIDDFYKTDEGRQAAKDEMKQLARGGEDHKLSRKERKARQAEVAEQLGGVSNRYARLAQKRAEKNYQQMVKEDSLQMVKIVNDKASNHEPILDKETGYPSITFLNRKDYQELVKYAESKGIKLDKNAEYIDKDTAKALQECIRNNVGDFGDKTDLGERKSISKDKDISFTGSRRFIEALNVDTQKSYKTAIGVARGALALATLARGLTKIVGEVDKEVEKTITEEVEREKSVTEWVGDDRTGHYDTFTIKWIETITKTISEWIHDPGKRQFIYKRIGELLGPQALLTFLDLYLHNDTNVLKKNKGLEDVVYKEGIEAFKKLVPNARKEVDQFMKIAEEKGITKEQQLAMLQKAMGNEGKKLNGRELLGAIVAAKSFKQGDDAPTVDDVDKTSETVFIMKQGQLVDEKNNPIKPEDLKLVDEKGNPVNISGSGEDGAIGAAIDKKIAGKSGKPLTTEDLNNAFTNPNEVGDKSQIIISDQDGEVMDVKGDNVTEPASFVLTDNSNKQVNKYTFVKLTAEEVAQAKLPADQGPYYKLTSAVDDKGNNIGQTIGKVFKYNYKETETTQTAHRLDEKGQIAEDVTIVKKTPKYFLDAATRLGESSPVYIKTGANPK